MTINERIFALLAEKGKSQTDMCRAVGVPQRTISAWKMRGSDPSANLIPGIASFFGVSVEWLLTGREYPRNLSALCSSPRNSSVGFCHGSVVLRNGEQLLLSDEADELLRLYDALDVRRRIKLLDMAFVLSEEKEGNRDVKE